MLKLRLKQFKNISKNIQKILVGAKTLPDLWLLCSEAMMIERLWEFLIKTSNILRVMIQK